jgi:hypothetical protein
MDKSILQADLNNSIAEAGHSATIRTVNIPCLKSKLTHEQVFGEYGYGNKYQFSITVNYETLGYDPVRGESVAVGSRTFAVMDYELDSDEVGIIIHLGDKIE